MSAQIVEAGGCAPPVVVDTAMRAVTIPQPAYALVIHRADGRLCVRLDYDGRAEYGENATPDEGARLLWEAVGSAMRRDAAAVAALFAAATLTVERFAPVEAELIFSKRYAIQTLRAALAPFGGAA